MLDTSVPDRGRGAGGQGRPAERIEPGHTFGRRTSRPAVPLAGRLIGPSCEPRPPCGSDGHAPWAVAAARQSHRNRHLGQLDSQRLSVRHPSAYFFGKPDDAGRAVGLVGQLVGPRDVDHVVLSPQHHRHVGDLSVRGGVPPRFRDGRRSSWRRPVTDAGRPRGSVGHDPTLLPTRRHPKSTQRCRRACRGRVGAETSPADDACGRPVERDRSPHRPAAPSPPGPTITTDR